MSASYVRKGEEHLSISPDIEYISDFIPEEVREDCINLLSELPFEHSLHVFDGKTVVKSSVVYCWATDTGLPYVFGKSMVNELTPRSFKDYPILQAIREYVEKYTGKKYNSILINKYSPDSTLGEHCDDDPWLGKEFDVPSISLGGERIFRVKTHPANTPKGTKRKSIDYLLKSGSLVLMGKSVQRYFHHSIPKQTKKNYDPKVRYNLTFRNIHPELFHLMPRARKMPGGK